MGQFAGWDVFEGNPRRGGGQPGPGLRLFQGRPRRGGLRQGWEFPQGVGIRGLRQCSRHLHRPRRRGLLRGQRRPHGAKVLHGWGVAHDVGNQGQAFASFQRRGVLPANGLGGFQQDGRPAHLRRLRQRQDSQVQRRRRAHHVMGFPGHRSGPVRDSSQHCHGQRRQRVRGGQGMPPGAGVRHQRQAPGYVEQHLEAVGHSCWRGRKHVRRGANRRRLLQRRSELRPPGNRLRPVGESGSRARR